jgi:cytochrome oxidase Cu insertion factor (SCO1/SenC/PrrC family)
MKRLILGVGILAVALGLFRLRQIKSMPNSGAADLTLADFGPVPDFSLTERSGKTVTSADLRGKPWVGNFIFTRCGGPCPLLSMRTAELQKDYLPKTNLSFVSFTVDPEYDSPKVLTEYAQRYGADSKRWLFLTGNSEKVYQMINQGFHLAVEKNKNPKAPVGEAFNHSLSFVLVDANGRIRGYYAGNDLESLQRLRRDIKTLLNA